MASRYSLATNAIATCATPDLLLKHWDKTFTIYVWRQMKHLKHKSETLAENIWKNTWKAIGKHMQHPDKTLATYVWNIRNIQINTLATYVYSYCNICNIPIYFCNIHTKHLQHTFKTSETLMRLQHALVRGTSTAQRTPRHRRRPPPPANEWSWWGRRPPQDSPSVGLTRRWCMPPLPPLSRFARWGARSGMVAQTAEQPGMRARSSQGWRRPRRARALPAASGPTQLRWRRRATLWSSERSVGVWRPSTDAHILSLQIGKAEKTWKKNWQSKGPLECKNFLLFSVCVFFFNEQIYVKLLRFQKGPKCEVLWHLLCCVHGTMPTRSCQCFVVQTHLCMHGRYIQLL
jgi:hypothetical protein